MATGNIAQMVAATWEDVLETSPYPFRGEALFLMRSGECPSYRERLDRPLFNWRGEAIPRIATVRLNLARLGKPRRIPRLP